MQLLLMMSMFHQNDITFTHEQPPHAGMGVIPYQS